VRIKHRKPWTSQGYYTIKTNDFWQFIFVPSFLTGWNTQNKLLIFEIDDIDARCQIFFEYTGTIILKT